MSETALSVEIRDQAGKGVARKLRANGRIPAVLYARGKETVSLTLDPSHLQRVLSSGGAGMNTLIDLEGESLVSGRTVLVKDLQRDPARGLFLHADLYEVDLSKTVEVAVPVRVTGTAHGVTLGGILDHTLREVEFECLPRAIPDEIVVDVTALDVGDVVHVRDLALPEGVELRTDSELAVLQIVVPAAEEEPEVAEAAAEGEEGAVPGEAADESAAEGEGAAGETPSGD